MAFKEKYLISTETLQYPATMDRTEHGLLPLKRGCVLKIGQADDTEIRTETLDGTFVSEKPIILYTWKKSKIPDIFIHKELEKRGFLRYRKDRNREFFEFDSIEQAIREINDIIYGTKNLKNYLSREEQIRIAKNICNLWKNTTRSEKRQLLRALINGKMRMGKCHTSYRIIKDMGFKKILILTYKPNGVSESWEDDIDHVEFKDFTFKKAKDLKDVKFEDNGKVEIIFASFQDAIGEVKDDNGKIIKEHKDKWKQLIKQDIDLVIMDEQHYGYETEKSKKFLSKLNYTHELALSGTPFKAILDGKYDKEEVFTWTYLQEQQYRKNEKENDWATDIYRSLPEFEVYNIKYNTDIITNFLKYYTKEEKVTNLKLFSNETLVYDFLTWLKFDKNINGLITNHMFWYLPQIINCNIIEKTILNHPHWKGYTVINASGNSVTDLDKTKNNIYNNDAKTITLSCGRWGTGSTVKQWQSVWMLDDGYSAENWFQTGMRCGSPWVGRDGEFLKEKVHIVDFNSDRMLKCYIEYSTIISKYVGYDPSKFSTEMLKCMPIYSIDGSSITKIDNDELFNQFNRILIDSFGSLSMLNKEKMDDEIKEIIKYICGNLSKEESFIMSKSPTGRGKNNKKNKINDGKIENIIKIEDYIIKARLITNRFKNFLYVVDNVSNISDIFNYKEEFKNQIGIKVEEFKIILDKGFIIEEKINDSIKLFNINNDYIYS